MAEDCGISELREMWPRVGQSWEGSKRSSKKWQEMITVFEPGMMRMGVL